MHFMHRSKIPWTSDRRPQYVHKWLFSLTSKQLKTVDPTWLVSTFKVIFKLMVHRCFLSTGIIIRRLIVKYPSKKGGNRAVKDLTSL